MLIVTVSMLAVKSHQSKGRNCIENSLLHRISATFLQLVFTLWQVNGQMLIGCKHSVAVDALRSSKDDIVVTICDGFSVETESRDVRTAVEPMTSQPSSSVLADNATEVSITVLI